MPAMRVIPGIAAILLTTAVAQAQIKATCPVTSCAALRVTTISGEMRQTEEVKLTITDAIVLAEQHAGRKVVQASLLLQGGDASYTVVALPHGGGVARQCGCELRYPYRRACDAVEGCGGGRSGRPDQGQTGGTSAVICRCPTRWSKPKSSPAEG